MALLSKAELEALVEIQQTPCVSLYMPAHQAGPSTRQDPIRLKNLLKQAEERLTQDGMSAREVETLLKPASDLLENYDFWQHQNNGLAMFLTSNLFRCYRLPLEFEELAVVGDRFHIKPLLPLFTGDGRFYLLALSQNQVRFFEGTRYSISPIDPEDVPESIAEALQYDQPEAQLRFHSTATGGNRVAGHGQGVGSPRGNAPTYHGQGVGTSEDKSEIHRFLQQVDSGLQPILNDQNAPLVLAGVDYLLPIYRSVSSYNNLLEQGITGNPELMSPEELHDQAWKIVEPHFQENQNQAINEYRELAGTGRATGQLQTILPATYDGQVDTLFVSLGMQQWGKFDPQQRQVEIYEENTPESEDLLDLAAVKTLLQSGTVYAVEADQVPEDAPAAAIFRYPVYSPASNEATGASR